MAHQRSRLLATMVILLTAFAFTVGAVVIPSASAAASPAGTNFCQVPIDVTMSATVIADVNRFDVGNHESGEAIKYDRVVLAFDHPVTSYRVRYVPQIIQDASGMPVTLRGTAALEIRLNGASAHDIDGQSTVGLRDYSRNWTSLREAKVVSDFEGVVVVGLGLATTVDFTAYTLTGPNRLVIDLAMPGQHPWSCQSGAVRTYFFNERSFVANVEPFFTPVWRRVATPSVAGGALNSLFHGPLVTEQDNGLRLVNSDAIGVTGLRISDGIAYVRLVGGCNARGSTVSVAGSIFPTLRQFPNVQYVKIFDPSGNTGRPTGRSDSIPDCLNP